VFVLITFSPNSAKVEAEIHKAIAPHGAQRFNLPGAAIVMKCKTKDDAERSRVALVKLRASYNARGRAFEYMWLRVNPSDFAYHPSDPAERPGFELELLRQIFARDT
jgi:hypothetical protein